MRYDDATIEQVRAANDIVDIVGRHVRLTKKGANYFGLCPFHGEKTASFSVSPRKQIYYCFGCGAGGSVINFLMEYENYSFSEALKVLADNAHIELPEGNDHEDKGVKELRARLLEINKEAAIYYNSVLRSPAGAIGYEYFSKKRKLSNQMITRFGLGFSEKTSDSLYKYLKSKGYDDNVLSKSGLVTFTEKGVRDKFWNRVIFPIMDTNNRVIGFGGRVMGDGEPKYLNSPETLIFDKSSTLYGLNYAKKSRQKYLLLCEGYMDVIALHQAGFTNAVASLGTAFTEKHARLLKRYTDNVILTQDSDAAGIKAKMRAFPILYDAGLSVKVLDMGKYKDPDEFIKAEGPEGYEQCISKAKNAFLFLVEVLRDGYDLSDPAEKTKFIRETANRLCMFKDSIERDNYIDSVSREFMIDRDELKRYVDRLIENGTSSSDFSEVDVAKKFERERRIANRNAEIAKQRQTATTNEGNVDGSNIAEGFMSPYGDETPSSPNLDDDFQSSASAQASRYEMILVSWLAERPDLANTVFKYLKPEEFHTKVYRLIAENVRDLQSNFDPAAFLNREDVSSYDRQLAAEAFAEPDKSGSILNMNQNEIEKGLTEAIRLIRSVRVDTELQRCGADMQKFGALLKEKNELKNLRITL